MLVITWIFTGNWSFLFVIRSKLQAWAKTDIKPILMAQSIKPAIHLIPSRRRLLNKQRQLIQIQRLNNRKRQLQQPAKLLHQLPLIHQKQLLHRRRILRGQIHPRPGRPHRRT